MAATFELVIKPRKGWQAIDFNEVYLHRELLGFLVWRDIKIRYRQTLLGGLWAILQPLTAMLVFTFVFNRLAGIRSDGPPYPLFAFAGLAPWTFFANAVTSSSNSLVANQHLVSKIYFPRIFIPIGSIGALLVDLALSLGLLACLVIHYHWHVTYHVFLLPIFILVAFPFLIQMGIFVTPVIYPLRYMPARLQPVMGLNPMAGVVLGFRHALLGSAASWNVMGTSLVMSVVLFVAGLFIFRRMERRFADII
jgi:lipopolysaccharide transport system permease protein